MRRLMGLLGLSLVLCGCPVDKGDVTLAKPALGFQLQAGPFEVAKTTETQRCFFFTVPGTPGTDVWIHRWEIAQNTGTHHVNIFRVKTIRNLDGNDGDVVVDGECFKSGNWSDWPLAVNSQNDSTGVDWTLPDDVGARFSAGEKLMLQVHYVNATTQTTPTRGLVFANFHQAATPPSQELGTLFATNQNIRICPGDTNKTFEAKCTFSGGPVTIAAANGHFHSRGQSFTIAPVDAQGAVGTTFYTSSTWNEPPMETGLSVQVPGGGGIDYRCSYTADTSECGDASKACCFTFGPKVETQEHCNAFVYYYPKRSDITCF
jgi:hypothetical protein